MKRTIDKADVLLSSILYAVYMLLSCIAMMVVEILIVDLLIGKIITTFVTLLPENSWRGQCLHLPEG